ncbi:CHASE2 domain-containing protein [Pantanalinema sp. GBBB05]|uniref:CHASE2 domain-containing protein n=1 Tax=Pantanalinema sp. GBBB05 TaxID=2604139 RepID=UPI003D818704
MTIKLNHRLWTRFRQQTRVWRTGVLPGVVVISCITIARLTGSLQVLEWMAFDYFLRSRPIEPADPKVVIVGINETDIKAVGKYPIPDRELATLLRTLQQYQPRAIGLDVFRDLTADPHRAELAEVFRTSRNLIGIETALGNQSNLTVKPPPELPPERIGMVDVIIDPDGKLRRSLLASKVDSGDTKYALPLRLAALYLGSEGIPFQHGERASDPIRLGQVAIPRFRPTTGSYVGAQAGGNQVLLNFHSHAKPFHMVSMMEVINGEVDPFLLHDRVVLIGMTAASVNDTFMTSATKSTLLTETLGDLAQYQVIYGVEYQAHATSQLINAALNGRPLLHTWIDELEYLWIWLWGLTGITLGLVLQSPWKTLLSLALSSAGLVCLSYALLVSSWWIPVVPTLLALCAAGLTTSFFDRDFRSLLEQRSVTLKQTYDAVHNGPLQTLAAILRSLDDEPANARLRSQLQALNQELRSVYESMNQALITGEHPYSQTPIQELLYQVYENTLQRDLPGFASIKTFIPPDFTPLKDCPLTADQKQGLCLFLQEALCNVGNHAIEATYLDVACKQDQYQYSLQIIDNGMELTSDLQPPRRGRGTDQAKELARSLRGKFCRAPHTPQGIVCQLTWEVRSPWLQNLISGLKLTPAKRVAQLGRTASEWEHPSEF